MSDTLFLALVFVISASNGFLCLFQAYKVQAVLLRICNKHRFFGLVIGRWWVASPYYISILRMIGVGSLLISFASLFGLVSRR